MTKIDQAEATRRIAAMLTAGQLPVLVVAFRLDQAGAVCVDIGCAGGIADAPMLDAALELAMVVNATTEMVHRATPPPAGTAKVLVEHLHRSVRR